MRKAMRKIICCMVMFIAVLLTACSTSTSGNGGNSDNNGNPNGSNPIAAEQEWVFVPERIEIQDKRADYDAMQLIGGTVCYLSMNGGAEGEKQSICRYSLADRELKSIPIDWKDDGSIREISCYTFDENCNTWLIVNVYSAGFGQFRRFLYKFDSEGQNVFFKEITEQLGGDASVSDIASDGQGRIYVFNPEAGIWLYEEGGNYHGAISYDSSEDVQVKGAASGDDGRFYVCISKGEEADHCMMILQLMDISSPHKKWKNCLYGGTATSMGIT